MRQILPFINLNSKIINQKSAKISIFNEGFLYGKGIFTTIKVREGVLLFFERHLNRLETSATQLNIRLPSYILNLTSYIQKAACAVIKKNKLINGGIRITITPSIFCIHAFCFNCHSERPEGAEESHTTISVITTPDTRDTYKTYKLTYRIPHLLAQEKARSQGAKDALFTQNKEIVESTNSNIFSCASNNSQLSIHTPPISKNGLNGITRQILMENLPIREAPIPIATTNPLILVNSLSLRIIESIDGKKINQNPEFVNLIRQTLDKAEKKYITNSSSRTE